MTRAVPSSKSVRPIGATSRRNAIRRLDGRTSAARYLKQVQRELADHLGGAERLSAPQKIMIERVSIDLLRLKMLDNEMAAGGFSELDGRIAHALRNSVRLALRELNNGSAVTRSA
jgi:hypothetical protein